MKRVDEFVKRFNLVSMQKPTTLEAIGTENFNDLPDKKQFNEAIEYLANSEVSMRFEGFGLIAKEKIQEFINKNPIFSITHNWNFQKIDKAHNFVTMTPEGEKAISAVITDLLGRLAKYLCSAVHEERRDAGCCEAKNTCSCVHSVDVNSMKHDSTSRRIRGMIQAFEIRKSSRTEKLKAVLEEMKALNPLSKTIDISIATNATKCHNELIVRAALIKIGVNEAELIKLTPVKAIKLAINVQQNIIAPKMQELTVQAIRLWEDEFELERLESIDNKIINPISEDYITMKGRSLKSVGRFKLPFGGIASSGGDMFWKTNIITEGPSRHSQADYFFHTDFNSVTASSLFYDNSVVPVPTATITLDYDIDLTIGNGLTTDIDRDFFFSITKVKFDTNTNHLFTL